MRSFTENNEVVIKYHHNHKGNNGSRPVALKVWFENS